MTFTERLGLLPAGTAIDLDNCAREPIHVPGAVQGHGVLLVVRASDLVVVQVSANGADLLGQTPEELLGQVLHEVVGQDAAAVLLALPGAGGRPQSGSALVDGTEFDVLVYEPEAGYLSIELVPAATGAGATGLDTMWLLAGLRSTTEAAPLLAVASRLMREVTGYDRVWAYEFAPDGHGVIVAEEKPDRLPSFLGLHFPESDIPAQARDLYLRNGLRTIVDVLAPSAPMVPVTNPDTGSWTDMSDGALRAVSPMHVAYLRQMGVRASASAALVVDGRLWGLLSAHHYDEPRQLGRRARALTEVLAILVSMQLDGLERASTASALLSLQQHQGEVLERVAAARTVAQGLAADPAALLGVCRASGALVRIGEELLRVGQAPPPQQCEELLDALADRLERDGVDVLALDSVGTELPQLAERSDLTAHASGVLVAALSRRHGNLLVWLRPEQVQEVTWGGRKAPLQVAPGEVERLTPRGSFETWRQTVQLRSRPWLREEVTSVRQLLSSLGTLLLSRAEALSRANSELVRVNAELDAFAYSAAHDLREPLRGMNSLATFLVEDYWDVLDEVGRDRLSRLVAQARRMAALLDSLLDYASLGRGEIVRTDVDVLKVADTAAELLRDRFEERAGELRHGPPGTVQADPTRLLEVLSNLLSNALKYNTDPHPVVEVGVLPLSATVRGREVVSSSSNPFADGPEPAVVYVRDNGIGIRPEDREDVFAVFRRLHAQGEHGGGSGAGLAIVRRIVERHGGRVWVEDHAGPGTTVCFTVQP